MVDLKFLKEDKSLAKVQSYHVQNIKICKPDVDSN